MRGIAEAHEVETLPAPEMPFLVQREIVIGNQRCLGVDVQFDPGTLSKRREETRNGGPGFLPFRQILEILGFHHAENPCLVRRLIGQVMPSRESDIHTPDPAQPCSRLFERLSLLRQAVLKSVRKAGASVSRHQPCNQNLAILVV